MKEEISQKVKLLTFDSGSEYVSFRKKYCEDPREYISTTFDREELLAMMQLPYARKLYDNKNDLREFVSGAYQ